MQSPVPRMQTLCMRCPAVQVCHRRARGPLLPDPRPPPPLCSCSDGYFTIYRPQLCSLKYQNLTAGTNPETYGKGPNVPWQSGIVTITQLGACIGSATAVATASATAGCGSIAYGG